MLNIEILSNSILQVARRAGEAILDVYQSDDFGLETKGDESPLTRADLAAHEVIASMLRSITPDTPVVSEEDPASLAYRTPDREFWLIDPLDGTKEFVARNGEFTVNIALVRGGLAVWGVVYAPVQDSLYWGGAGMGAFVNEKGATRAIECERPAEGQTVKVVASKSHLNDRTQRWIEQLGDVSLIQAGSSLKLCQVASGGAHVYPRLAPTCEWDTAAAQAVVEGAGGWVTDLQGNQIRYAKAEILNPDFIASAISPSKLPKI